MRLAFLAAATVLLLLLPSGCSTKATEDVESTEQRITSYELSLSLPKGAPLHQLAAVGSERLELGNNADTGALANSGTSETDIGVGAHTASVWSRGNIRLRSRAVVTGSLFTEGSVSQGADTTITGTVETGVSLTPIQRFAWNIDFLEGATDVRVRSGGDQQLPPGPVRDVSVDRGGTLRLTSGRYDVRSLRVAPGAHVVVDSANGPIFLYVASSLELKEPLDATSGGAADILVGYLGQQPIGLDAPFAGTLVAPFAAIKLSPARAPYTGAFFARDIDIQPYVRMELRPFAGWGLLFPPTPILDCVAHFDASHSNALWGYNNTLDVALTIPEGSRNYLAPGGIVPTTTFEPGLHERIGWSPFSSSLTWTLGTNQATADAYASTRCLFSDLPPPNGPPTGNQGESASQPSLASLALILPPVRAGVSLGSPPAPQTPPAFPERPFQFVIDGQMFGSDAACGPRRLYVLASVNGVTFPRRDLEGCTNPGACGVPIPHEVFEVSVPSSQPTVPVHVQVFEVDTSLCGGDDDEILTLDLQVDNATGRTSGGLTTPTSSRFLNDTEHCATGGDDFGICWSTSPTGRPRVCTSWVAQYIDSGSAPGFPGVEDFAATTDRQQLRASFSRAELIVRNATTTSRWAGTLDKDGCVPPDGVPPAVFWQTQPGLGSSGLTVTLRLASEQCLDPTGNNCGHNAAGRPSGSRMRERFAEDQATTILCTIWTQDSNVNDTACAVVHNNAGIFPGWVQGSSYAYPPNTVEPVNPSDFEITELAASASHILKLDAEGADLGISTAVFSKLVGVDNCSTGIIELVAQDPSGIANAQSCTAFYGRDRRDTAGNLTFVGDTHWKYVIAHEVGHALEEHALGGSFFTNLAPSGLLPPPKCDCGHVEETVPLIRLHCMQSIEEPGGAQSEGFAHFFAARAWNRATDTDCTFHYYKEFLNDNCMAGVAPADCRPDPSTGLVISKPPIALDCTSPVRWRNNECLDGTVSPGEMLTDFGVEYDWMSFLYTVNTLGPNHVRTADLFGLYRTACGGDCDRATVIAWEACQNCAPGVTGLRTAAEQYFASSAAQLTNFLTLGDQHGVSRTTAR